MAIDPKLVSIKKAGDLPSGIPTATGEFLYFEDETLMKAEMSDLYDRLESAYLGIITPSSTIPSSGSWYGTVLEPGIFNNVTPAITVNAADFDVENGMPNNEVRIIISEGVATKDVRRVKGDKGDAGASNPDLRESYNLIPTSDLRIGTWNTSGGTNSNNLYVSTSKFAIENTGTKTLSGHGTVPSSSARFIFYDSSGVFISAVLGTPPLNTSNAITFTPPETAKMMAIVIHYSPTLPIVISDWANSIMLVEGSEPMPFEPYGVVMKTQEEKDSYYVANSGLDTNDGTYLSPFKTLEYAYQKKPKKNIIIKEDGDYFTSQVFSNVNISSKVGKPRIISGKQITSATLVSGKVWKADENIPFKSTDYELWQHDIPDANSLIELSKRNPLQRGLTHRLSSTRLTKVSSIAAIESAVNPSWYHDGITFYFSKVDGSDLSINPIVIPSNYNISGNSSISNVALLYGGVNSNGKFEMASSDVLFSNVGVELSGTSSIRECRIGGSHNNGIGYGGSAVGLEEKCWIHDCLDEGSSAHTNTIIKRYSGYYEHNRSGITDVGASHSYCENMLLMYNTNSGFIFTYSTQYGKNDGNAVLFNCVTDQGCSSSTPGRIRAFNCKFKTGTVNVEEV